MKFSREKNVRCDGNNGNSLTDSRDLFDQLPYEILLEIFNKVVDAKSLVRCLSVSKRFKSIIPQIDYVFLRLPRHRVSASKSTKLFNNLVRFLHSIAAGNQKNDNRRHALYHSPTEMLKAFGELKSLHIELPCSKGAIEVMAGNDSMLKWKAEFGASLESCVILGANSVRKDTGTENDTKDKGNNGQSALNDEDLKKRIVWVISSLIAASARHYLTKRVVSSFPALKNVVVSDSDKRGRVFTRGDELGELKVESADVAAESSMERSLIPDLEIKLWYVPNMVLKQSGCVVEGATLVVIRPVDHNAGTKGSDGGEFLRGVDDGFDGEEDELNIVSEAIREIVKMKKTYFMEMTAF